MSNAPIAEELERDFYVFSEVCINEECVKYDYFTKYVIPYVQRHNIKMFHDEDRFFKIFSKAFSQFVSRDELIEVFLINLEHFLSY